MIRTECAYTGIKWISSEAALWGDQFELSLACSVFVECFLSWLIIIIIIIIIIIAVMQSKQTKQVVNIASKFYSTYTH